MDLPGVYGEMTARRKQWTDYLAVAQVQPPLVPPADISAQPKRRRSGSCKRPSIPERDIQRAILQALELHPMVARVERINVMAGCLVGNDGKPSRFMRSCKRGRVDLDGFTVDGRVIAIEVKRPTARHTLTLEQREYPRQVRAANGIAGVATCVEEAIAIVEGRNV